MPKTEVMHTINRHVLILVALTALAAVPTARAQDALAKQARAILKAHCFVCHGEDGAAEGGLNFILDANRLVSRRIVVPKDPLKSKLYRQVKSGNMPKDLDPLSPVEIETLRKWIEGGGRDFNPPTAQRKFISPTDILEFIQADLKKLDANDRPFQRYFTITHLYNAGIPDTELETYRRGLSKLINSLSWAAKIVRPVPIDPARTVLRIDINDFLWTEKTWDRILDENPYGVTYDKQGAGIHTPVAAYCYKATGTDQPFIRADWFVARASVPPLYHDILDLPKTDRELEKRLRVDVARNLRIGRAARAGFTNSGVSQNNRLIERHNADLTRGAYWKSYDFAANSGRKNLFAHPLGPSGARSFEHDGGEIIFNLPNGLQAYLLTDAKGNRIDKGPTAIVRDPKRPDSAVVNGLSCMSCHTGGMIFKDDEIRAAVLGNAATFTAAELNSVKRLYPTRPEFRKLQEADAKRFADAVTATGGKVGTTEPIVTLVQRFEEPLDLPLAAAEAGLPMSEFLAGLKKSPRLSRTLAALVVPGGTVKRDVYVANFGAVVSDLQLGTFAGRKSGVVTNSIGMKFRLIPAGEFMMGSAVPAAELAKRFEAKSEDFEDEFPRHRVQISRPFFLGQHEVTVGQFRRFVTDTGHRTEAERDGKGTFGFDATTGKFEMDSKYNWKNVGFKQDDNHPVVNVSWNDAVAFCSWLTRRDGVPHRLPTEAEWEYACRGGTTSLYFHGDNPEGLSKIGNVADATLKARFDGFATIKAKDGFTFTAPVGNFRPNSFGLFDTHGNVWEWCSDWYGEYSNGRTVKDPTGPAAGSLRVGRGGSWYSLARSCRSADRGGNAPGYRSISLGFRVLRSSIK